MPGTRTNTGAPIKRTRRLFKNRQFRPAVYTKLAFNQGPAFNWDYTVFSFKGAWRSIWPLYSVCETMKDCKRVFSIMAASYGYLYDFSGYQLVIWKNKNFHENHYLKQH